MSAAPSVSRPPVPRRAVPIPPPIRSFVIIPAENDDLETQKTSDLAACIAKIKLDGSEDHVPLSARLPPPVPPRGAEAVRRSSRSSQEDSTYISAEASSIDLAKLLTRLPPPPPISRRTSTIGGVSPKIPISLPPSPRPAPSPRPPPSLPRRTQTQPVPPRPNLASKPVAPLRQDVIFMVPPTTCIQCRDFTGPDTHAALFPRQSVQSLEILAHDLTRPFEYDVDKARALFTWLHYNIVYDAVSFLSGNIKPQTPESTLSSGLAVCDGYGGLFERLADIIGLQAHKVSGHGKGYGYQPPEEGGPIPGMSSNHAWNCVFFNGEWHLIDACWGAGCLSGTTYEAKFAPQWFISSPAEFGRRHFPEDPSFQLTPEQVTWDEYILLPEAPVLTGDFYNFDLHPLLVEPSTKIILEKRFTKFSVSKRCEHMSSADRDNYVFVIGVADKVQNFTPMEFNEEEGSWSTTIFTPRDGTVTLYTVDTVSNKDAKGLGVAGYNQAKGRKAMSFKGLASWTVVHL